MRSILLIMFLFAILVSSPAYGASKAGQVKQGNEFYKKGDYEASLKSYEDALKADPESAEINFNLGTALYKDHQYADAIEHLQKGLLSDDPVLKKNTHFNLGNAFFGAGLQVEKKDVERAIKSLEESLRQYDTVVNLDDKDNDARYNQGIVKKEIQRLKKKQEQQQKQKPDQNKQDKQEPDQNNSEQKNEDPQDQNKDPQEQDPGSPEQDDKNEPSVNSEDSSSDKDSPKDQESGSEQAQPGEMSKEEARALLKEFEQNEAPTGLLDFGKKKIQDKPVLKDW